MISDCDRVEGACKMKEISCNIKGYSVTFEQAREMAKLIAEPGNDFATLVSWCDRDKGTFSVLFEMRITWGTRVGSLWEKPRRTFAYLC